MKITIYGRSLEILDALIEESEEEIQNQLNEYFNEDRKDFNLNYTIPKGFVGEVMKEIDKIEHGETKTYGEIADSMDSIPVAVGQACAKNPLPLIVPCHRVIGKNSIGGYLGDRDSNVKKKLLELEDINLP